jgi:hypothetical protein
MPTITKEHLDIARNVASKFARGAMSSHFDDLVGVAYLRLAEIANDTGPNFNGHVYMQCRYAILNYLSTQKSGRIHGEFPMYLDAMPVDRAEALVNESRENHPCGTKSDLKVRDGADPRGNFNSHKTHCKSGHPYTSANTVVRLNGKRLCKECNRIWCRKTRLRGKKMAA